MIRKEKEKTYVLFGKGTVIIGTEIDLLHNKGICTLTAGTNQYKIGSIPPKDRCPDTPDVILEFEKIESIDVLIRALEHIKEEMKSPPIMSITSLAC